MRTRPGIEMSRNVAKATTIVLCPYGCRSIVLRLRDEEGVYPTTIRDTIGTTEDKTGDCPGCGESFRIAVTTETR